MRLGAAFWLQQTGWPGLRDACLIAERAGWDSLWLDDHLLNDEGDPTDPKLEGWATLSALAVLTERVRLGLLVAANTFRGPGLTERLDRLDEAVGLLRRLLDGETVTHEGAFYSMHEAVCTPRPVQARLPILIGGSGPTKTLRTTARYADLWNGFGSPERIAQVGAVLRERCAEVGRPFEAIERTVTVDAVVRDTTAAALAAWAETARRHDLDGRLGSDGSDRGLSVGGPVTEVAPYLARYRDLGVGEVIVIFRAPFDVETLERVGELRSAVADIAPEVSSPY
jgi:alkanesulfonate monooxygenase SsuD/methylene tetrahydromethanopterin reductase-like flavin-dependent oxidoreductase (luciferase family)